MRSIRVWVALCVVSLSGCNPQQPPAPAPSPAAPAPSALAPILDLKPLMEWVVDPAADVIWDSVKTISTETGTREVAPQNDEQWHAVRNAAATLMETANLLMVPGRARDDGKWASFARGLTKTAGVALKAAENKNKDQLFAAGGDIYVVCKGCHVEYAKHLSSGVVPSAPTPRQALHERIESVALR
jgi:hypothetical protein